MNYLEVLENESIDIIRNAVSKASNPVMLTSLGKDSSVLFHLIKKAFFPSKIPFPLMHIDTNWKFKEMYEYRDNLINDNSEEFIIFKNETGISKGINPVDYSPEIHTRIMKTEALLESLNKYKFDVVFGGSRRDEEKSRAKERLISLRDENHSWDPKKQNPEIGGIYNNLLKENMSARIFPLSNWTELDIWRYIYLESIEVVDLYFAKKRKVYEKDKQFFYLNDDRLKINNFSFETVRFRTLGCHPLTACIKSSAKNIEEVITELESTKYSERSGRIIDFQKNDSMEKKKKEGYF